MPLKLIPGFALPHPMGKQRNKGAASSVVQTEEAAFCCNNHTVTRTSFPFRKLSICLMKWEILLALMVKVSPSEVRA